MRTATLAAAATLSLAAGNAAAGTQTNFLTIHYVASSIETADRSTDRDSDLGFGFTLTKSFWDYAAWFAELDWRDYEDDNRPELDFISASIGAGPQLAIEQLGGLEVFAGASLEHMRFRLQDDDPATAAEEVTSTQNNGVGGQIGLSFPLLETAEIFARYKYINFTNADDATLEDDTVVRIGGRYGVSDEVSVLLSYETYDEQEINEIRLGVGLSFD